MTESIWPGHISNVLGAYKRLKVWWWDDDNGTWKDYSRHVRSATCKGGINVIGTMTATFGGLDNTTIEPRTIFLVYLGFKMVNKYKVIKVKKNSDKTVEVECVETTGEYQLKVD